MQDIVDFWANIDIQKRVHPEDCEVMKRIDGNSLFNLNLIPGCFWGPLRTAKIVFLFSSPGEGESDERYAESEVGQAYEACARTGLEPLPSADVHPPGYKWWSERVQKFGQPEKLASQVAFLNIGAYHSKTTKSPSRNLLSPENQL